MLLVTEKCELKFEKTKCLFLENRGDKLERMKKELADIKEELDALIINRPPLEERILRMKGKIYFLSMGLGDDSTIVVVLAWLGYYYVSFLESRESKPDEQYLSISFVSTGRGGSRIFEGGKVCLYLGVAESIGHAPKML